MSCSSLVLHRTTLGPSLVLAMMLCSASAFAQHDKGSEGSFSYAFALGAAARPGGDIGSLGLVAVTVGTPWRNTGVRLDGSVTEWPGTVSGRRLIGVTGNLVYRNRFGFFAPYLLGGLGGYAQSGAGTSLGVNGGVGIRVSVRLNPFIELREHLWSADRRRRATVLAAGLTF